MSEEQALKELAALPAGYDDLYWACVQAVLAIVFERADASQCVEQARWATMDDGPVAILLQFHQDPLSVAADIANVDVITWDQDQTYGPIQDAFAAAARRLEDGGTGWTEGADGTDEPAAALFGFSQGRFFRRSA